MKHLKMTKAERMALCDLGFYNDAMRGYLIKAMDNASFRRNEIQRALAGLEQALDEMTAAEAETLYQEY